MTSFPKYERYKDSGVEWLGDVPEHWEVEKGLHYLFETEDRSVKGDEELLSVSHLTGVTPRSEKNITMFMAESYEGSKLCEVGDIAVNTMWAWMSALGVSKYRGLVSPSYSTYRQKQPERFNATFLDHLIHTGVYKSHYTVNSTGITTSRLRLYPHSFLRLKFPCPPIEDQDRIVAFLDRKTAEIDTLIAKKQRQIELLDEQKAILINRAVTRGLSGVASAKTGLNPNAKLKPSGIEWIGDIPEHWEILQLRRLNRYGTSITYGIVQAGPDIEDGIPYIRTSDMKGTEFGDSGFLRTSQKIDNSYRRSKVEEGDLVIAIRATLGKALTVPKHLHGANLTQGTAKVAPGPQIDSGFLAYAFNSSYCQEAVLFVGKGTTFLEITLEALRRIKLAVPPISEQHLIVSAIDRASKLHAESVGLTLEEIQSLKALRRTLIAHAVTGKIKVV